NHLYLESFPTRRSSDLHSGLQENKLEAKKIPTRIHALMDIAAKYINCSGNDNDREVETFIQEIDKARKRRPSWWSNPLSWVGRQDRKSTRLTPVTFRSR